jgi:signal transduction histidine kinase
MVEANPDQRILILAPIGRDAELARRTIRRAGMDAGVCAGIDDLCSALSRGVGAILVTQEALSPDELGRLLAAVDKQPPWSDLPMIVLAESGAMHHLADHIGDRANATFLERPTGAATLVRAVEMALRARRRQYELREYLGSLAQAQEAERKARALAEEAVSIRDQFLASVAHDLKNPLGGIMGFAQLLQRQISRGRAPDEARLVQQLSHIERMAVSAIGQIEELMDVARLQAAQPLSLTLGTVDLVALVRRVAEEFQGASSAQKILVAAPATQIAGSWDGRRLERVVSNLLGNAIKYSPDGGDVEVRLQRAGEDVVLTVEDQGIGIPAADLPRVFDQFYRGRNAEGVSGTGLGLTGVRQIVEQHGGAISIQSEEGKGTVVTIRLPATPTTVDMET